MRQEITQQQDYLLKKLSWRMEGEAVEVAEREHLGDEGGDSHQIFQLDVCSKAGLCERTHQKGQVVGSGESHPPFLTQL